MMGEKESMVGQLASALQRRGYADLRVAGRRESAGSRPDSFHWEGADTRFAPDIMAKRKNVTFLFQVETADTLRDPDAAERARLFSASAEYFGLLYCLVVPVCGRKEAMRKLHEMHADERFTRLLTLT